MDEKRTSAVTAVITVFQLNECHIKRSLESVLNQNFVNLQIVIVYTGGNESEFLQLKNLISTYHDCSISVETTGFRCNAASGRNFIGLNCESDYLAFLDDDDEWDHDKISRQVNAMIPGTAIVCGDYYVEDQNGMHVHETNGCIKSSKLLGRNAVGATSFPLISADRFRKVNGFDESFESNQEWDLWIRLARVGSVLHIDGNLGTKHESCASISRDRKKRKKGWYSFLFKYFEDHIKNPKEAAEAYGYFYREMVCSRYMFSAVFGFGIHLFFRIWVHLCK